MDRKAWIAASGGLAARLCALLIVAGTAVFTWRGTLSVVVADAWRFTASFLARYYDGTIALTDFFAKRNSLDHAQPVQKLLLLANARFLDLDFAFEAMIGILFGILFVALIVAIVRTDAGRRPRARLAVDFALLGTAAIVFSLNELGVFNWSLATLSLFYPLGVALMLVFAFDSIERDRAWLLGIGTFAACLVLDTSAILTAAAVVLLIASRVRRLHLARAYARPVGAVIAGVAAYVIMSALVFPAVPLEMSSHVRIAQLSAHAGEIWKALVVPFGAVVMAPSRIEMNYGAVALWPWLVPSALLVWIGHLWFWREFLRRRDERLAFVAAGLMLFFYATIAGIVWGRVPRFGFDYLMQSRYLVFYELQLVAILMLACSNLARTEQTPIPVVACGGGVAIAAVAALWFLHISQPILPFQIAFNDRLAATIVELANDPASVPADCPINHLNLCAWPLPARAAVLDVLRRERLNVFSPDFRARHGLPPLSDAPPPAPAAAADAR